MEKTKEHDGCMDCVHVDLASDDYPCSECSCNYTDKYEKREEAKELTRSQIREAFLKWYGKAMDMAIEALQAEAEWIPCSERLPNEDEKGSRKKCKRV